MAGDVGTLGTVITTVFHSSPEVTSASYNTTHDATFCCQGDSTEADGVTKNLVVPSVMFFLGFLGNVAALIILTVKPRKDSKSTAFYQLVKALACTDLFGIIASSPVTIIVYIGGGVFNTGGQSLCHYISFILIMAGNGTLFTVLVMAVERFIVTKYPFKYSQMVTPLAVNCSIATIWGVSSLIAVLPIVGVGGNIAPWPGTWCFFNYRSTNISGKIFSYYYALSGLLTITITIILNLTVIHHLWCMRRNRLTKSVYFTQDSGSSKGSTGPDSEIRLVIFLMAIIIVFTVCYAPLMVRILVNQIWNSDRLLLAGGIEDTIDLWALRLACLNQILDPWVYIIGRISFCSASRSRNTRAL